MSSKLWAVRRLGAADVLNVDDLDDYGFLPLYFFLGGGYGAGEDFQLPLRCFEPVVYARPVCIVMFIEVIGMFGQSRQWAMSSVTGLGAASRTSAHVSCATRQESIIVSVYKSGITPV
jgi:hypothetical protein